MAVELAQREPFPASVGAIDALEMLLRTKRSEVTRLAYKRDLNQFFRFHTRQQPTTESVARFLQLHTAGVTEAMHRAQARAREAELQAGLAAAGQRDVQVGRAVAGLEDLAKRIHNEVFAGNKEKKQGDTK